jgi:hypothetical protein
MIPAIQIAAALLLGYTLTAICALVAAFGLTSASPAFVMKDHHLTASYKRVQALVWLVCVCAGAFVTSTVAQGTYPITVGVLLATILIGMLWWNSREARQRGMAHQILMSMVSVAGVAAGYGLARHFLKI